MGVVEVRLSKALLAWGALTGYFFLPIDRDLSNRLISGRDFSTFIFSHELLLLMMWFLDNLLTLLFTNKAAIGILYPEDPIDYYML
jgi:hypothetical protein